MFRRRVCGPCSLPTYWIMGAVLRLLNYLVCRPSDKFAAASLVLSALQTARWAPPYQIQYPGFLP